MPTLVVDNVGSRDGLQTLMHRAQLMRRNHDELLLGAGEGGDEVEAGADASIDAIEIGA